MVWRSGAAVSMAAMLAACQSVGPATIGRDHFDYNKAIAPGAARFTDRSIITCQPPKHSPRWSIAVHRTRSSGVRGGPELPETTFVATYERGHWFWIDEHVFDSTRAFSFRTMLMSLAESGAVAGPVVTIGTGGN